MDHPTASLLPPLPHYELRFQSLADQGRAFVFPCDAAGHVDLDALSERARDNYLYARTVVGREFSMPAVTSLSPPVAALLPQGPRGAPSWPLGATHRPGRAGSSGVA